MPSAGGRIHEALCALLRTDPVQLVRAGRPKRGIDEGELARLRTVVDGWPVASADIPAACTNIERLARQIDRTADRVAQGPDALPWLAEDRREILMAAYSLDTLGYRSPRGIGVFGDNPSRYVHHADELADRLEHILSVLEARLDALDATPVVPDRSFPPDLAARAGQQIASLTGESAALELWAEGEWDPFDHTRMNLRLTATTAAGDLAGMVSGYVRDAPQLTPADAPAWASMSSEDILAEALSATGLTSAPAIMLITDLVVATDHAGRALGAQIAAQATHLVDPAAIVLLAARPRANRVPPSSRDRLSRYWREAGWHPLSAGGLWVRIPA